jgi:hypothetical protein
MELEELKEFCKIIDLEIGNKEIILAHNPIQDVDDEQLDFYWLINPENGKGCFLGIQAHTVGELGKSTGIFDDFTFMGFNFQKKIIMADDANMACINDRIYELYPHIHTSPGAVIEVEKMKNETYFTKWILRNMLPCPGSRFLLKPTGCNEFVTINRDNLEETLKKHFNDFLNIFQFKNIENIKEKLKQVVLYKFRNVACDLFCRVSLTEWLDELKLQSQFIINPDIKKMLKQIKYTKFDLVLNMGIIMKFSDESDQVIECDIYDDYGE